MSSAWPDAEQRVAGYVSGPTGDALRFSLSGRRNTRDGYVKNVFDGRELNDRDDFGFRGKLEWEPSEALRATLIGDYWKRDADCCIWTWERFGPPPGFTEQLALNAGVVPGRDNLKQNIDGDVFSDSSSYGSSLQLDYEMGGGYTLTSISAWRTFETRDGLDSDSSPLDILNVNYGDHTQRQISQELRLISPTGGFVDYVAGLYFFRSNVDSFTRQFFPTVPFPFFDRAVNVDATTRNVAAFGQADLNLTDELRLILGARVLREKQEVAKDRVDARLSLADSARAEETDDAVTWRTGVQYEFTHDVIAFATVTRGFKGGGFDSNIAVQGLRPVGPEEPTSYEIGLRTAWPQAGLTFNVTAFKAQINDYQT
ncbi:MAG: TonB-dependent receptor, partial [Steroidobacteraceae bacterium]